MTTKLGERIKRSEKSTRLGFVSLGVSSMLALCIFQTSRKSSASAEIIQKIAEALKTDADEELLSLADQIAPDVAGIINSNSQAVPRTFLRAAKDLSPEQWNELMKKVEDER